MSGSRWTRDPVVIVACGALLAACAGWAIWGLVQGQQEARASGGLSQLIAAAAVATAAVLAAGALLALRGWAPAATLAAVVVGLLSAVFVRGTGYALTGFPIVALLVWASARLYPAYEARHAGDDAPR